jgi:putative membrane protein
MEPEKKTEETLRLHLANERTLLAWIRTGISLMGFGFAIARFGLFLRTLAQGENVPVHGADTLGSAWAGTALVALGMLANLSATVRFGMIRRAIHRGEVWGPRAALVYVVGGVATLVGLALSILLARSLGR